MKKEAAANEGSSMPQQMILLYPHEIHSLRTGGILTLSFGDGIPPCLIGMAGVVNLSKSNGHVARSEPETARQGKTERHQYKRRQYKQSKIAATLAKVRAADGDFEKLRQVAKDAGIDLSRLRSWVRMTGGKWAPVYTCHQCRPPKRLPSGPGYTGHLRIHEKGGKLNGS